MTPLLYAGSLSAALALSIVLGLVVGPRLKHSRETQTIEVREVGDFMHIRPEERAAFILGERMRITFKRRERKPVDEFTTRLEWAFATMDEEVRS
jgi:hypothetical protein